MNTHPRLTDVPMHRCGLTRGAQDTCAHRDAPDYPGGNSRKSLKVASNMDAAEDKKLLEDIATRLSRRHQDVPQGLVASIVGSVYMNFDDVPIRDFVPVLVERKAAARLAELAHS